MIFISITILALVFVYLGWRIQTNKQTQKEELSGKGSTFWETSSSLFTVLGAGEYGFAIALILSSGMLGTSFLVALGFAFIAARFISHIVQQHANNATDNLLRFDGYRNYSTPDYFADYSGNIGSLLITLIDGSAFIGILLVQFIVGGLILSHVASMPYSAAVLLMAVTVLLYSSVGGLRALFHTDIWQGLLMWAGLIIVVVYLFWFSPDTILLDSSRDILHQATLTSLDNILRSPDPILLFILTFFAAFSGPDVWQRISTSENTKTAKAALIGSGASIILFSILIYFLSAHILIDANSVNSGDAFLGYLDNAYSLPGETEVEFTPWPPFVAAIFSLGLISAFISTADTSLLLLVTLTQNQLRRFGYWTDSTNNSEREVPDGFTKKSRWWLLAYTLVGIFFALSTPSIVDVFGLVIGVLSLVGLPTLLIILGYGKPHLIIAVLLLEIALFIFVTFFPSVLPEPLINSVWSPLIPLLPACLLLLNKRRSS